MTRVDGANRADAVDLSADEFAEVKADAKYMPTMASDSYNKLDYQKILPLPLQRT